MSRCASCGLRRRGPKPAASRWRPSALFITQSALSGLIKELEATLACACLTAARAACACPTLGAELYPQVEKFCNDLDTVVSEVATSNLAARQCARGRCRSCWPARCCRG